MTLKDVPVGASVTKRTGEKVYNVCTRIRIFPNMGEDIVPDSNEVFLGHGNCFNRVHKETEVLWLTTVEEYIQHVNDLPAV